MRRKSNLLYMCIWVMWCGHDVMVVGTQWQIRLGVRLKEAVSRASELVSLHEIFHGEKYLLAVRGHDIVVALVEGATQVQQ